MSNIAGNDLAVFMIPVEPFVTEPEATEELVEDEVPAVTEEPVAADEPEATEEPAEANEPEATEEPEITDVPETTEEPEEVGEPNVTEESVTTEEPVEVDEPEATEEPVASDGPEATEEPEEVGEPNVTEEPVTTEEPAETDEPEATEEPAATDEPEATEEPTATTEPEETDEDATDDGDQEEDEAGEAEPAIETEAPIMMMASAPLRNFYPTFKSVYAPLGSFVVGQTGVHGSSGDDSYKQLAAAPDYGTVYATPHYLGGVTVYCLEHMFSGPGENNSDGSTEPTGPYTIANLDTYLNTPGVSQTIFSRRTMHAIAWVLRHSYPYQVLDLSYADNENWCRAACQFAIRQVIKELEGDQFVRYYWDLDEFFRRADSAPEEYLAYARWLADNAIAYASVTGNITVTDKSVDIVNGKYVYSATFTTDAALMRIEKKYGTITGHSGGSDETYYYLQSGDKITLTSSTLHTKIKAESLPSPDDECFFMVGIPSVALQKVIIPYAGAPYPYKSSEVSFSLPLGSLAVVKKDAASGKALKGTVFELLNSSGTVLQTKTTGDNGKVTFSDLAEGTYTVREKTAPEGYTLGSTTSQKVTVKAGETASLTFKNDLIQGKIYIQKADAMTKEPLAGVTFTITRLSAPASHGSEGVGDKITITTNSEGVAETDWLPWGEYKVQETVVPEHYEAPTFVTTVNLFTDGETEFIHVENEPTKGAIKITKTDALDGTPIAGVQFDIYYNDEFGSGLAATMTTDENGVATSPPLRKGKYLVQEHDNPTGYTNELVSLDCIVASDETTNLSATNCPVQGQIEIRKTDELTGEALAGAVFTITRIEGLPSHNGNDCGEVVETLTSDANGYAASSLLTWGTYRVEETTVPEHYVDNHFSTDVVIADEDIKLTVDVANEPTKGWISLTKTDRLNGNPISGVKFDIYYNDQYGEGLAATMETNDEGIAVSPPLRKGSYLVKEHGATDGYVFEELNLSAVVLSDETTYLTATNQPVQVQIQIYKRDTEESFGDPSILSTRGDAVLTGAEFQIVAAANIRDRQGNIIHNKGDVVVESLKTVGENASVMTELLWPGKYEIVEIAPPVGYQPSTKKVAVDTTGAADQSAKAVIVYDGVKTNKVIYGAISIVKFVGDNQVHDSSVVETPEKGATFEVYLKSAGAFENAREFERDTIVTNKNGKASTKALPYGVYVLHQTVGQEGHALMEPIEFMIDGSDPVSDPPTLILNNVAIRYKLRIIKMDAETGNTITLANTAFKLKDSDGEYVQQQVSYPTPTVIDTFVTDETGAVTLPEHVKWGHYTIEEVVSPEGYVINSEGVSVFVGHVGDEPDEVYELEVQVPNDPVKGQIVLEKKGKQLVTFESYVDDWGNECMRPVYEERYLVGAVFEIRAAEDIVGKDGTVWYRAGDVVETITTTAEGSDRSSLLPLGKYIVQEVETPEGYVCDPDTYEVELAFADNQTAVVELKLDITNEYLPAEVMLEKTKGIMETQSVENGMLHQVVGTAPGEGFVFGIYNVNPILYGENTLPEMTLLATAATDSNGKLLLEGCFPHGEYVVKELIGPAGWQLSTQSYPVSLIPDNVEEDHVIRISLDEAIHNELIYSTITLTKTDITGENTIPGAVIEVSNELGDIIYRETTDENGCIPDIPVMPGRYTFREVIAPEGYALNEAVMSFTVDENGNVVGDTTIKDDFTRIQLMKQERNCNPLAGVEFTLYTSEGQKVMTATSDVAGVVTFERIPYGSFIIKETKPLPGYNPSDEVIEVTVDGTFVNPVNILATITNERMVLTAIKTSNTGEPLGGAEFQLINAITGDVVDTAVSAADGTFTMSNFFEGYWVLKETKAPSGFSAMKDIDLTVDEFWSDDETITCVNIPDHYSFLKINHYWQPLEGVKFAIEDLGGNKLQEASSDKNGVVTFTGLRPGSYVIREIEALYGYTRSDETIQFTIDENYQPPKKLKRMTNYPDIETGIDLIFTPGMIAGLCITTLAIAAAIVLRVRRKKQRNQD